MASTDMGHLIKREFIQGVGTTAQHNWAQRNRTYLAIHSANRFSWYHPGILYHRSFSPRYRSPATSEESSQESCSAWGSTSSRRSLVFDSIFDHISTIIHIRTYLINDKTFTIFVLPSDLISCTAMQEYVYNNSSDTGCGMVLDAWWPAIINTN